MPRRYSDYPYCYKKLHMMSSWGAFGDYISTWIFLFILWEGVISRRPLIFAAVCGTSLEYSQHAFPLPHHNWRTNPLIYSYPKGRHYDTVGYIRVVKMVDGREGVVINPRSYRNGSLPERGQGWA